MQCWQYMYGFDCALVATVTLNVKRLLSWPRVSHFASFLFFLFCEILKTSPKI